MSTLPTIAFVSIGQSPRRDIISDFTALWGERMHILDIGALDELSLAEIKQLAPLPGESDLITRLRDGQSVFLSHDRLLPHMEKAIQKAAEWGAQCVVILCTGDFSTLHSPLPLLLPSEILAHSVASLLKAGDKLTVIVPTQGQIAEATERWSQRGYEVVKVICEEPFGEHKALLATLKMDQDIQNSQGLIADCFGFDLEFFNNVAKVYDRPVFVSRTLIAHLLLATH